jgi:Ca2+-binding RTX toxin-like protein
MKTAATTLLALVALAAAAGAGAATLAAPAAATGPVSAVAGTSATATGTVNPGGESTTVYVEYGTTTGYGKRTASKNVGSGTSGVGVTADMTALAPATTYHYRVVATNASGTAHGGDGIVTTLSPPVVAASAADGIGPFHAALHGSVNPNGLATSWYFEYGKSTSYGTKTAAQNLPAGTSAVAVAAGIQGLQAGVTYHFRLVASSNAGTSRSSDRTFVTDAAPAVRTGRATSVTSTAAVLAGTVNPKGRGSSTWFEYGTTTGYGAATPVQDAGFGTADKAVTAALAGLRPGTTYHFRIAAKSDAGTTYGADSAFKTSSAPDVVTGAVNSVGADRVTVTGSVNANGRSTTWWVEIGATTHYTGRSPKQSAGAGTSPVALSTTITGLAPGATYHYRVVAQNSAGARAGADATFKTAGPPTVQSGPVTRVSVSSAVVWGKVNALGLAGTYWAEYGRDTSYGMRTPTGTVPPATGEATVSFPLSGLVPGVRYHFRIVASSAAGTTAGPDASFGTAPLPRSPSGRAVLCTIVGTVGPDTLRGTPGPDVICGLGGGDVIRGLGGNDIIYAGPGDDVVDGGAGNDVVYGGTGNDRISGGVARDRLTGGPGHDLLLGGPGADMLIARDRSSDTVNGGPGRDRGELNRGLDVRVSVERLVA